MKNTLVVVADFGGYKAFNLDNDQQHRTPRLVLVDQYDNSAAHDRLGDTVSDLGGRFPRGAGLKAGGAMSDGERHNIELESRKRLVRQMAQRLNNLAGEEKIERCFLAASKEINGQLLQELEPKVRSKIEKNLAADLTKVDRADLLSRF